MKITCGILLFNPKNQFLVAHVTRSPFNVWSIPKGMHEKSDPSYHFTARREFKEETSVSLDIPLKEHKLYPYPEKKKYLKGFYGCLDENIDISHFKCKSMVNKEGFPPFPEVDAFAWMEVKDFQLLHITQQQLLYDIILNERDRT